MVRWIILSCIGIICGIVLAFWWSSYWPTGVTIPAMGPDLGWRIHSDENSDFAPLSGEPDAAKIISYHEKDLILYGVGTLPTIRRNGSQYDVKFTSGQWIVRSFGKRAIITIQTQKFQAKLEGVGGVYVDIDNNTVANFDATLTVGTQSLLPSFLLKNNQTAYYDVADQNGLIPSGLWGIYLTHFPLDRQKILGDISIHTVDNLLQKFLNREPESSQIGVFNRDTRARNALKEMQVLLAKILSGENCGATRFACFELLDTILVKGITEFPSIFSPLDQTISFWIQLDPALQNLGSDWTNIMRVYHSQILFGDARAQVVRDKALLEMIRSGSASSSVEVWDYLMKMLSEQKTGSAYSLQIIHEIIRIGDMLYRSKDISDSVKNTLALNTIGALANIKNILENTYFTKREYWFVLRDDLVDEQGLVIKSQTFITELQGLIAKIDDSAVLLSLGEEAQTHLHTLRAQLVWFNCIFSRNDEYVVNPRICRTTMSE